MEYLDPTLTVTFEVQREQTALNTSKMLRVTSCLLLCGLLVTALPYPFPDEPVSTAAPVAPTPFPLAPTPGPLPGYNNNPYYNYRGGAAVPIVAYSNQPGVDGTYSFSFATADGKQAQESGYLKDAFIDNQGEPQGTQVVQGSYAYVSPDGTPIEVTYVADENGFRPSGVHIPTNGKTVVPTLDKDRQIVDPTYNRYNPYLNGNRYNYLGQYNNQPYDPRYNNQPYDPRYPYNSSRFNSYYNNYNPYFNGNAEDIRKYNVRPYDPRFPYDGSRFNPRYPNDVPRFNPYLNNNNPPKTVFIGDIKKD